MNGIWIRSQDKEALISISCITYEKEWCDRKGFSAHNVIITETDSTEFFLGEYTTEDRAQEVIDEIQHNILICSQFYEMPQE